MKTVINIGLAKQRNITGVEFDKPFKDITSRDVMKVAIEEYPEEKIQIIGWCDVTNNKKPPYL